MAIPRDFVYQRYEGNTTYTILTSDLALTSDLIDPTKDCVIYADIITLDGSRGALLFPGRNLTICCRSLIPNSVPISTRPPDTLKPAPSPKPRTSDDRAVNQGNPNGQDADPITGEDYGGKGGSIKILAGSIEQPLTLTSSGGRGRDGQRGGDAGRGSPGAAGSDDREKRQGHFRQPAGKYPGSAGGNGQAGGNGGRGGRPGSGGDAGEIAVFTVASPPAVSMTAAGGLAGKPGDPGKGAAGGGGGQGGRLGDWRTTRQGHNHRSEFVYTGRYPNGQLGASGHDGQSVDGQGGSNAATTVGAMAKIQDAIPASPELFAQLQLMMQVVKMHYLDGDFARAKNILAWIFGITADREAAAYAKKWQGLHQQAATYLSRLSRGLDYFGNAANFVPTASFGLYCSTVTPMLVLGGTVQTVFDTYTRYLKDQNTGYDDFNNAYSAGAKAIGTYQKNIGDAIEQRKKLWDACLALDSQVAAAQTKMLDAEKAFKDAVERKQQCLKFAALINMISSLAGFPSDVADVAKSVKEAGFTGAGVRFGVGLPSNFLGLAFNINVLKTDLSNVKAEWDKTEKALVADGKDTAKLAADANIIDEQLGQYMDLPEARAYNAIIKLYVGLCRQRNSKVIECSTLDEDVIGLNAKIDQTKAQMDELKSIESGKLNPTLAPYRNFLLGLYNNYKDNLIDQLFFETMAFRYRTLTDFRQILQSSNTLAELSIMQGQILQAVIDHENKVGSIEQPFSSLPTYPMRHATEDSIASFKKGSDLIFTIPFDEDSFQGLAQLQLTSFSVSLPGVQFTSGQKKVYIGLKCHGDCSVVDSKSPFTVFRFTHNPISAMYQYEVVVDKDGNKSEKHIAGGALVDVGDGHDQKSISLSPFCTWTLSLPSKFNVGVDVSQVQDVILSFGGKGLPASATLMNLLAFRS